MSRLRALIRGRADASEVLLDGPHVLLEALRADVPIELIVATRAVLDRDTTETRQLWSLARASGAEVFDATSNVMDAISPVRTPSGVVALATWTPSPVADTWAPEPALAIGLVDVQDPGNVGAVIRCADGLDATGVIAIGTTADPAGWKALRGAMGSTFRIPVARATVDTTLQDAHLAGVRVLATTARHVEGTRELRSVDLRGPVLLLLGNEGSGLPEGLDARVDGRVYVDMRPGLDSFNVSVTAGLLLYEARRQRVEAGRS